jgi:GT2 family glycosyltransferase
VTEPERPTVAVVIPTHDRRVRVLTTLAALDGQTRRPDQVIVVDDASTDGTADAIAALDWNVPVTVVRRPAKGGPAAARNSGLAAVRADVVAWLDSDCVPAPGWLAAGFTALGEPGVAIVQGRTAPDPAVAQATWAYTQDIDRLTGLYEACNLFVRADDLRAAGGFPEHIGNFGEDIVAAWRVLRAGGRGVFCDAALAHHEVRQPGFAWFLAWARLYRNWPLVVREIPELRERLLWHRWFLRRADAEVALGLLAAGLAVTTRRRWPLLALTPWLVRRRPRHLDRGSVLTAAQLMAFDAATVAACAEGSIRHRALVL